MRVCEILARISGWEIETNKKVVSIWKCFKTKYFVFVGRNSSVGRALDWRSKCPWFDPWFRQLFYLLRAVVCVFSVRTTRLWRCEYIALQVTLPIHSCDSLRSETFFQRKSGKLAFLSNILIFHISAAVVFEFLRKETFLNEQVLFRFHFVFELSNFSTLFNGF